MSGETLATVETGGAERVPPGYKRTEVGVIPEDWECVSVGEVAKFSSGVGIGVTSLRKKSPEFSVPVFGGNGIAGYTTDSVTKNPTIVIGRVGQKCGVVYRTDEPSWITDNALYPKQLMRSIDLDFFALAVSAAGLNDARNRNDLPLITQSIMHSTQIALPLNIDEQRTIAAALSDVDALISSLDRLISKKRAVKTATMQQLLIGKQRLRGYASNTSYKQTEVGVIPEDWPLARLGDVSEVIMGQSPVGFSYNRSGSGIPLLNGPTEFTENHPVKLQWTTQPTKLCKPQDLLLCVRGSSTGRMNVANDEYCLGRGVAAIRAGTESDTVYLTYQVELGIERLLAMSAGSTFPNVDGKSIRSIELPLPSLSEQRAIATVLSDMDAEVEALEARREKTRQIKQGMMQELLTGRTRLVEEGSPS